MIRYRYVVRISPADVGRRVVVRWRRPTIAGPDEVADVVGMLEAADERSFQIRDKRGRLTVVPVERAMAAKVIERPSRPSSSPAGGTG